MNNFQKKHKKMIGGLSRTSRVKRVNMESSLFLVNDVLFRELLNSKSNYRDLPSLIDVNFAHDPPPPPLPPLRPLIPPHKITLLKHKPRTEQRIRCGQKCRYFEDICFSFRGRTQINSKRGVVTNYRRRNDLQPATSTSKTTSTTGWSSVTFRLFDFVT